MNGKWFTVYIIETVKLSKSKLPLDAQSNEKNRKQEKLGCYIPSTQYDDHSGDRKPAKVSTCNKTFE